jgi:hypothetical protein
MKRRVFWKSITFSCCKQLFPYFEKFADTPFEVEYWKFYNGCQEYIKPDPRNNCFLKL